MGSELTEQRLCCGSLQSAELFAADTEVFIRPVLRRNITNTSLLKAKQARLCGGGKKDVE